MKKLFYLLMALPLFAMMTACDDDDNKIPDVSISVDYDASTATLSDGTFYIVKGETFKINGLVVTPAPGTGKAVLGNTTYSIDGFPFYTTGVAPFGVEIATDNMDEGNYILSVNTQILQVDKSLGWGVFQYKMTIVPAPEDQPGDEGGGTDVPDATIADSVD